MKGEEDLRNDEMRRLKENEILKGMMKWEDERWKENEMMKGMMKGEDERSDKRRR